LSALAGRILVTRPAGGWEALERRVAAAGGSLSFRPPTVAVPPLDPGPARRAARDIGRFTWIVLTSARGATFLSGALEEAGTGAPEVSAKTACVGPATARAARARGFDVELVSTEGEGAALASRFAARLVAGDRVLVVRPETGSVFPVEQLAASGAAVEPVAFYRLEIAPEAAAIERDLASGSYDAVVFTSPSSLAALRGSARAIARARRVALGATTAASLAAEGLAAHATCERPTPDAVADALESLC